MALQLDIYHLKLMNDARANPAGVAAALGIDLNEGLSPGTISSDPKPPLALNTDLTTLAVNHSQDMLDNDFWSHTSPTTGTTEDRYLASPYDTVFYGENLSIIPSDTEIDDYVAAKTMFDALFIDEGVDGRGHRLSILNDDFKEVGIGHLEGEYAGDNFTHMLTVNFGLESTTKTYAVGCVYTDSNANAEYDVGEGLSGITINAEIGGVVQETTTTDSFGYYHLELDYGTYDIVAETTNHDSVWNDVKIQDRNHLIDLLYDPNISDQPSGVFTVDNQLAMFNDPEGIFSSIQPSNVVDDLPSQYTISWTMDDTTKVFLDGFQVNSFGSQTFYATSGTRHRLRSIGPAGITELEIDINVSVVAPFSNETVELASGLNALYGPSYEQMLRIY